MSAREINIVVVGVSTAGIGIAKTLAALNKDGYPNLRVTIVDKNPYSFHAIGAPRGLVDEKFGRQLFFRLDSLLASFELDKSQPRHRFVQAALVQVRGDKTLELSNGDVLAFDYLVLATGASNHFPANIDALTVDEARVKLAQVHENVKQANRVLVIGGGAVGVEMAGEIATEYPGKSVTLVHSRGRLLPENFKPGLSAGAVNKLERLGVKVVLNERIDVPTNVQFDGALREISLKGTSGREYVSDVQIMATGTKLHTEYLANLEKQLGQMRESNGAIRVQPTLQIDNPNLPTVFAVGDVNSLPAGAKYAVKAAEQSQLAAHNVVAMVRAGVDAGRPVPVLQSWNGSVMNMIAVPIGRSMGVMQAAGLALGKSCAADFLVRNVKGKDYFIGKIAGEFPPGANA
ncbi:hypothetical protein IWW55_000573 [Coemansia sp. RSA 2706]|nr:hypothetical protein LPJ63_004962 [Coemansia sp. RSA 2711]KAJ2308209.1 hypothetical protein IWW55_000573 [Coemansia sp. RSA 2706]KAJ2313883.1 hypothetical protein IWW54_001249 [Coemansia sp. RSA 2705]KAJ2328312.1 hypothetical protein IWW51_001268 [Coemansia sp. RSA 2702]KAJ2370637.1 hypothetical protein H4S01_000192 [Coemansia sp. RSA 2610]KAJ2393723.1 hypothetical protein H4S02_000022 [Coemansia sp. RSA 2611]KAJ2738656.1 hypothetical protein H4R23_001002 [Coemansia sp. Cherry 401B]